MSNLNEYNGKKFPEEFEIIKTRTFRNLFDELPEIKRTCLLFDFDDCLTNMYKLQVENNIEDVSDDNLEQFLDTYTPQVEPKKQIWEIIFNKKSYETIMVLTGNKWENVLSWLFNHNLERCINHVFSTWSYESTNIEDIPQRKRNIIEFVGAHFDEVIFFDDSEDNLLLGLEVPNVRAIKVSTEYPDLEE